jgi:putative ABC transport system permease protein
MIGFDLDDTVYIPAGRALELFDRDSLFEVDVLYEESAPVAEVVEGIRRLMLDRHGDEDITITTQQQMLDTLGSVLGVLSFAVAALGSISLLVGAVGIFTIMTIAVRERTSEVGLLRALGAERDQVLSCFLIEAVALSLLGGLAGLAFGAGVAWVVGETVRQLPVSFSPLFMGLALGLSVVIGLVAGILPALNAARLDPVEALRAE